MRLLRRRSFCRPISNACDAIRKPSEQEIWKEGKDRSDHHRSQKVMPVKDDQLIDDVQDHSDDEYLADVLPAFPHQMVAPRRDGDERPTLWRPAFFGILQTGSYSKEGSRGRLQEQSQYHRPAGAADDVLPKAN